MPKVTINDSQGLVQSSGSGVEISSAVTLAGTLAAQRRVVSTLTTGTTLTAADSGKVFLLIQAGTARTATLPAPVSGLNFRFVLKTASTANWSIVQAAAADDFVGTVVDGAGSSDTATSTDTLVRFVGGTAVAGDEVELVCDGTNWYTRGSCDAAGGVIFA